MGFSSLFSFFLFLLPSCCHTQGCLSLLYHAPYTIGLVRLALLARFCLFVVSPHSLSFSGIPPLLWKCAVLLPLCERKTTKKFFSFHFSLFCVCLLFPSSHKTHIIPLRECLTGWLTDCLPDCLTDTCSHLSNNYNSFLQYTHLRMSVNSYLTVHRLTHIDSNYLSVYWNAMGLKMRENDWCVICSLTPFVK